MTLLSGTLGQPLSASELMRKYATDPVRLTTILLTTLVLGYGARVDNFSPFTVPFLESLIGASITGIEFIVVFIVVLEIIRRLLLKDFWLNRSPVSRPLLWVGVVLGVVPYLRMLVYENTIRYTLELIEIPGIVISAYIWLLVFRREDLRLMFWMVMIAGLFKTIEGISIYLSVGLGWGLLTGWRDAMLMALMVLAAFFAFVIKPDGDRSYQVLRNFIFVLLPATMFTYIGSTRRSFVLGAGVAILVMLFYFRGDERRRLLLKALPLVVVFGVLATVITGSSAFVDRLSNISSPTQEHSATYRLLELYNISHMILEKPIFGWPFGVAWRNYTVFDVENLSPIIPHNTYLYVTWRGGIIGLIVWIWFMVAMLRMHLRTIRAASTAFERFLAFWLASGTISLIVAGFTMAAGASHLKYFYAFLVVMTSYLPGAWPRLEARAAKSPRELA